METHAFKGSKFWSNSLRQNNEPRLKDISGSIPEANIR